MFIKIRFGQGFDSPRLHHKRGHIYMSSFMVFGLLGIFRTPVKQRFTYFKCNLLSALIITDGAIISGFWLK